MLLNGCGLFHGEPPEILYGTAKQAWRRGELTLALERTDEGIRLCGHLRDSAWPISFQLLKAEILLTGNRRADAQTLLDKAALSISSSSSLKPRLLADLAEVQKQGGEPDEALRLLGEALPLARSMGDTELLSRIEQRRGVLVSDFKEADAALRRSLDLARGQHDDFLAANALVGLGYIRLKRFRFDEAIPWFEQADRAAQNIPSKAIHQRCLGNLGWCYFRVGQSDRALEMSARAEFIAAESGQRFDRQLWLGNLGAVYYGRENFNKAISYYSRARDLAAGLGNREYVANWQNNITRAYVDQSDWNSAESSNRLAVAASRAANVPWVEAYTRLNSAFIDAARSRVKEGEADFGAAIRLAAETSQPNVAWHAHSGLADLYRSLGRIPEAGEEYAAAVATLDHDWMELSRDESKITFRGYLGSFYQDYVAFLSEQHRSEKALEVAESSRARLLAQKLEGGTSTLPAFHGAEAMRLARKTGCVLLSYWLAPGRSYLWAVTAKGVSSFPLPGESELNALIEQHRRAIDNLEDPLVSGGSAARQLYKTLIGPVEPLMGSRARVLIVPDGRLHEINFETLVVDGAKPHYWIDDVTVALGPSLGVLRSLPRKTSRRPRLLIIGDPLPADPEFPPLPHLKTEIREIAAGFAASDRAVYTGAEAYAERFRESDPHAFTAIHFAAHASADEESPLQSAIILSPHLGNYKLYASEVAALRLDPELVTVSACRSAGSKSYSGEGLIGFAWAFLEAGAHNVVAGIWNVDDAAAPVLMKEFYGKWHEGQDPATALRGAKLALMRTGGVFRKPYYWGPFEVFTRYATRSAMDLAWRNNSR